MSTTERTDTPEAAPPAPPIVELGCPFCAIECEPGWIETDNNGPIVACPMCNRDGEIAR